MDISQIQVAQKYITYFQAFRGCKLQQKRVQEKKKKITSNLKMNLPLGNSKKLTQRRLPSQATGHTDLRLTSPSQMICGFCGSGGDFR